MSTRGVVGMRMNQTDKIGYNHFDSYPTGLGQAILNWLKGKDLKWLKDYYEAIEVDDQYDDAETWDWEGKQLAQKFQDYADFLTNSLMCEWGYVINLDDGILEVYKGFAHARDPRSRYATDRKREISGEGYYGCSLFKEIPLDEIFAGAWTTVSGKNCQDDFVLAKYSVVDGKVEE